MIIYWYYLLDTEDPNWTNFSYVIKSSRKKLHPKMERLKTGKESWLNNELKNGIKNIQFITCKVTNLLFHILLIKSLHY